MTSLEGDNLVVFVLLSASEICPDKRDGPWREWPHEKEMYTNIQIYPAISTFAAQICYTNKFLNLRINFPGTP
jgi:hypothetical protein